MFNNGPDATYNRSEAHTLYLYQVLTVLMKPTTGQSHILLQVLTTVLMKPQHTLLQLFNLLQVSPTPYCPDEIYYYLKSHTSLQVLTTVVMKTTTGQSRTLLQVLTTVLMKPTTTGSSYALLQVFNS